MNLTPPGESRARILNYGEPGAGKTYAIFCILEKTEGTGYFIEPSTDPTLLDYLEDERWAPIRDRLVSYRVTDIREAIEAAQEINERMEVTKEGSLGQPISEDWFITDPASPMWTWAQEYYAGFGKDEDMTPVEQLDAWETAGKMKHEFAPDDWGGIKRLYGLFTGQVLACPGHVYLTAEMKELLDAGKIKEKQDIVRMYGAIGGKPEGERHLGHMVRTVLLLRGNNPATWRMTKVKDRMNEKAWGGDQTRPVKDFAMDYLVKIAGWRP